MTCFTRFSFCAVLVCVLAACVSAPQSPDAVAVKAHTLTPEYSSFDARMASDASAVEHAFAASLDPQREMFTRLESAYTRHFGADSRESLRIGDAVSSPGMWGSAVRYGGMRFGTQANTRADVIASPELATTGLAVLPTVEDALFASVGDPSTALGARSLAVAHSVRGGSNANPWNLVAADVLGRSETIRAPVIAPTRLVKQGCADLSVGVGKARQDYALVSNEYGPLFASTTVACAAPLGFTVEGHGEYLAEEVAALGVGMARQLGPIGTASVALASSRAQAGEGWSARFGFEHSNPLFNLLYRSRLQSREFREAGATALADTVMQRELASVSVNAGSSTLALAYATQTTWERERSNLLALQQSLSLGRGSLSMSAGHSLEDDFGSSIFISYKRPLGAPRPAARPQVQELDLGALSATRPVL